MKALCFTAHGDLDQVEYKDVADPEPGPGEVRVKVRACALNHLDIWVRRGWPGLRLALPHWCGADVAGTVDAPGPGVDDWEPGREVVIDPGVSEGEDEFTRRGQDSLSPHYHVLGEHRRGGAAEYVVVPAGNLMAKPAELSFPEAAAPLLVTLTAWRMLIARARLRPNESVLVVGAGGGVNSMAIQVARLAGARVYAVAGNEEKAARARELGAHEVIDRSRVDWGKAIFQLTDRRGVDVVVDNVGAATLPTSMRAAARGGRIVVVGNTSGPKAEIDIRFIFGKQLEIIGSTMGTHQDFRTVTSLLWSGRLKPVIDRVMPMNRGRDAYALIEEGEHFGKIILEP